MAIRSVLSALAALVTAAAATRAEAQTLEVGDKAPQIQIATFIKGDPIKAFEPGKTYVLDFWATWCAPCRASMPHLSELQKKHPEVAFIGVSVLEDEWSGVRPFVEGMGDRMAFRVALDSVPKRTDAEGAMVRSWLKAAGQGGIPTSFIINREGKIAWIGHPLEMDKPLERILAGKWDIKAAAETFRKQRPPSRQQREEVSKLVNNYKEAREEGDSAKMLSTIETLIARDGKLEEELAPKKLQLLMKLERWDDALKYARELERRELGREPGGLNTIAWGILDPDSDARPQGKLLAYVVDLAYRADEAAEHRNAEIADTLGLAYFESGNPRKALEAQKRAVQLIEESGEKVDPAIRARLAKYEKLASEK